MTGHRPRRLARQLPERASYRRAWSELHGGYDPEGSRAAGGWLAFVEAVARPLAARRVSPNSLTAFGAASATAAVPAATGRKALGASAAVVVSGLADSLDGSVAVLSGRATPLGYLIDSLADRWADASFLLALRRLGAPPPIALAAAAGIVALEYARARAANAGFDELGVVTVGERPMRIIVTAAGLAVAGVGPHRARAVATLTAGAIATISWVGAGQFIRVAVRELRGAQAAPISPATA